MDFKIELKVAGTLEYGYLFRVIKESFEAEGMPFYPTDAPHPDVLAQGWWLNYRWENINRRIWFRLTQNGWKHPEIVYRTKPDQIFINFAQPLAVTKIVEEIPDTDDDINPGDWDYQEAISLGGWEPIFPYNIQSGIQRLAHPNGRFLICKDGNEWVLANTINDGSYPVFYIVEVTKSFRHQKNARYNKRKEVIS